MVDLFVKNRRNVIRAIHPIGILLIIFFPPKGMCVCSDCGFFRSAAVLYLIKNYAIIIPEKFFQKNFFHALTKGQILHYIDRSF